METISLKAIAGTAMAHGLHDQFPTDLVHDVFTPTKTAPVFDAPAGVSIAEAVAVVWRDSKGRPVDGGFFGITNRGVCALTLIDTTHDIDTSRDPHWVAFGLTMIVGKLMVRQADGIQELPWSIIDMGEDRHDRGISNPTPARVTVRDAFLQRFN